MADEIIIETTSQEVITVGVPGPQGPAGAAGTGLETLTTQGDTLYRGASTGERLPIGSAGQVLKVVNGLPAWANESGAVTSVNGATGAVTVAAATHGANHYDSGDLIYNEMVRVSDAGAEITNGVYYVGDNGGDYDFIKIGSRNLVTIVFEDSRWKIKRQDTTYYQSQTYANAPHPWNATGWTSTSSQHNPVPSVLQADAVYAVDNLARNTQFGGGLPSLASASNLPVKTGSGGVIEAGAFGVPVALAAAAAEGTSSSFARADHVHPWPTANQIGAVAIGNNFGDLGDTAECRANLGLGSAATKDAPATGNASSTQVVLGNDTRLSDQNLNTTDSPTFSGLTLSSADGLNVNVLKFEDDPRVSTEERTLYGGPWSIEQGALQFTGADAATNAATTLTNIGAAAASHTHAASAITSGNLTHERGGLEADVSAYNGLVKISGGATSAVTVTTAGEALLDDVDAAAQRTTLGLGTAATAATGDFAAASHSHGNLTSAGAIGSTAGLPVVTTTSGAVTTLALGSANQVLRVNSGGTAVEFGTVSGGVTAVGASTADVLSVSGSDLVADDGGTIDSSDPFIKWDDAAGKLVYANPLSRPSGAFYVGLAPTTTGLGGNAINIQTGRETFPIRVASGSDSVCIGFSSSATASSAIGIGRGALATNTNAVCIGGGNASGSTAVLIGGTSQNASGANCILISANNFTTVNQSGAVGINAGVSAVNATGLNAGADLRSQFATRPFASVYWGGQTTNNTATILNLDATATNRFTIAANTALAVDILLVARRSDVADKWLVARRFLGIRRDGSNNTSLIGAVQNFGMTDQSGGSPTWSFALTADDTNDALQLEVTGATGETVQWRAAAFYRVV